jgi:hypothetical protein
MTSRKAHDPSRACFPIDMVMRPSETVARTIAVALTVAISLIESRRGNAPAVRRIETINAANLMAPVGTPFVAPGQPKEYVFFGPWVDYADTVKFMGATQAVLEKRALYTDDGGMLRVRLSAPANTSRGPRDVTIHVACPPVPFTDCRNGTLSRRVMVLRVGSVTKIEPSSGVTPAQPTEFTIHGVGLEVADLHARTPLTSPTLGERTPVRLKFTASIGCGTVAVLLRDEAEGGDVYPYIGHVTVSTTGRCDPRRGASR